MTKSAAEMVAEAKARVENLTVEQTAKELENGDAVLVDVREPDEREKNGSIRGSVKAPRGMLEFWADPTSKYHRDEIDPNKRIILHCASGGRSALAASMMKELGFKNVAHMDGGFTAWKESGKPVESEA